MFDGNGKFLRQITIDVPVPPDARMVIGNKFPDPMGDKVPPLLKPGAPWVICITPPPHQYLYTADAFPGRIYKLSLDGKLLGMLGKAGKELKAVRLDSRHGLPRREHAHRRRDHQLACAEADPAPEEGEPVTLGTKVRPSTTPAARSAQDEDRFSMHLILSGARSAKSKDAG